MGGDCEKPSAVQADMTRVSAAVASASKLTSLISSSAVSAPSRRRPDERLTRPNPTPEPSQGVQLGLAQEEASDNRAEYREFQGTCLD